MFKFFGEFFCSNKRNFHLSKVNVNNKIINTHFTQLHLKNSNELPSESILLDLLMVEIITDDLTSNTPNGWIDHIYYMNNESKKEIGYITFRPSFGQICSIEVDPLFRDKGMGKHMITNVVDELKKIGVNEVWAISRNDNFWKNVFNKSFLYNSRRQCYCMKIS